MRRAYWEALHTDREAEHPLLAGLSWVLAQLSAVTVIVVLLGVKYITEPLAFLLYICLFYVPLIITVTYFWQRGLCLPAASQQQQSLLPTTFNARNEAQFL